MSDYGLYQTADDVPGRAKGVMRQFGGIRVFGKSTEQLNAGVQSVCAVVQDVTQHNLCLAPSMLRYLVRERLGADISQRIFSALLGSCLRTGVIDVSICEGTQGNPFRVVVHADNKSTFHRRVAEVISLVSIERTLQIAAIRDRYFSDKEKGGWTEGSYIAARVVRLGFGEYIDRFSIKIPDIMTDAFLQTHNSINVVDAGGLAEN